MGSCLWGAPLGRDRSAGLLAVAAGRAARQLATRLTPVGLLVMPSRAATDRFADGSDDEESLLQLQAKKQTAKKSRKLKGASSSSSNSREKKSAKNKDRKGSSGSAAGSSSESFGRECAGLFQCFVSNHFQSHRLEISTHVQAQY